MNIEPKDTFVNKATIGKVTFYSRRKRVKSASEMLSFEETMPKLSAENLCNKLYSHNSFNDLSFIYEINQLLIYNYSTFNI